MSKNNGPLKTVLVTDDVDMLREMLRIFLESMNIYVLEASNAAEAIGIALSYPGKIDVLLTDIDIGSNSGWESAVEITRLRPAIRILYMSAGINLLEWDNHAKKLAGSYFVQKPFRLEALKALLLDILSDGDKVHLA